MTDAWPAYARHDVYIYIYMVVRVVEGLDRRDALLGIVLSAAVAPLLAPAGALADEPTTGTAAPTLSP
jgi:hypothetical protein